MMLNVNSSPTDKVLAALQSVLLGLIPLVVAHTWYEVISSTPTAFTIIFELHGIVLKLSDLPFLGLLAITTLRCVLNAPYRHHLWHSIDLLLHWRSNQAWLGLVGIMFLSSLWSHAPSLAIYHATYTLLMLIMVVVMAASQPQHRRWWIIAFISGACLQGILAVAQILKGGSVGLSWLGEPSILYGRAFGLTYNPNTLAGYLLIAASLLIMLAVTSVRRSSFRSLMGFAELCIVAGLLATRSRTAVIGLVIVSSCWFFRWLSIRISHRSAIIATVVLALVLGGMALVVVGRGFTTRELSNRLTFAYKGTLAAYQTAPLLGVGAGQVMLIVDQLISADSVPYYDVQSDGFLQPAHNTYLNILAELGPLGLLLFLIGFATPIAGLPNLNSLHWGISVCLLAVACVMLFEFQFWLDPHWRMVLFWLVGLYWAYRLSPEPLKV